MLKLHQKKKEYKSEVNVKYTIVQTKGNNTSVVDVNIDLKGGEYNKMVEDARKLSDLSGTGITEMKKVPAEPGMTI